MQLSQKQKAFSQFLSLFLECILNSEQFQKTDDSHSWCISDIMDSKKRG